MSSPKVASIVRRELAVAIRDLMHHGLLSNVSFLRYVNFHYIILSYFKFFQSKRSSMIPLMGCMSARNVASCPEFTHAWTIIVKYYEMKQGREYNAAPAR